MKLPLSAAIPEDLNELCADIAVMHALLQRGLLIAVKLLLPRLVLDWKKMAF